MTLHVIDYYFRVISSLDTVLLFVTILKL